MVKVPIPRATGEARSEMAKQVKRMGDACREIKLVVGVGNGMLESALLFCLCKACVGAGPAFPSALVLVPTLALASLTHSQRTQ